MKYNLPKNDKELTDLHQYIKDIDGASLQTNDIVSLGKILVNTQSSGLRDVIAMRFIDAKNDLCVPFPIEAIKKSIHTKFISSLIYACSHYDCSDYLQVFVDLLILKSDMSFVDSWYVIENMAGPIEKGEIMYASNKLRAFIETVEESNSLRGELTKAIKIIEEIESIVALKD